MKGKSEKPKTGRPSKLKKFTEVFEQVLNNQNILAWTDYELLDEINDYLEDSDKICTATFENWKAGKFPTKEDVELGKLFLGLYKRALRDLKQNLFNKFEMDDKWQRYAWILERKFTEWNLKQISEQKVEQETTIKGALDIKSMTDEELKGLLNG